MNVIRDPSHMPSALGPSVVTIGNFDGVHRGHRELLSHVRSHATANQLTSIVLTFEPHPVRFFRPRQQPFLLTTLEQKLRLIATFECDLCVVWPFDHALAQLSPAAFIQDVLLDALNATHVIVGYDFSFGKGRLGSIRDLERLGTQTGRFTCETFGPILDSGSAISSSRIREALRDGELEEVCRLLGGTWYTLHGPVVHGEARGRKLGFPTANIQVSGQTLPSGVFVTRLIRLDTGARLSSITNIGTRPTFHDASDAPVTVEAFVLDPAISIDLDLYGVEVELEIIKKLRDEIAFDSSAQLIDQIRRDIAQAKDWHGL